MPRVVVAETRRQDVAQAVLRIVGREGLESASLRNVAQEAGLAIGSVRHYFASQTELMIFTMEELRRRIDGRIRSHAEQLLDPGASIDRRTRTEELFAEFLPLDETRREEAVLWLAFITAARTRPEFRPCARRMYEEARELIARVLHEAQRSGGVPGDLDIALETQRLAALLDGLTLGGVLHPDQVAPDAARAILHRHLRTLVDPDQGRATGHP
ncbi:TetR/AcrR family transcriptional regulator [Streptomyces sp. NPDC002730]|uniref:TetR/AcrR family transcriptional regulator n=1 Tax=unclassified Streptomyces TaxID=2593676 RepID=UPI0036BF43D2